MAYAPTGAVCGVLRVLSYVPAGTTTLTHADELINIRMPLLPISSVGCKHTSTTSRYACQGTIPAGSKRSSGHASPIGPTQARHRFALLLWLLMFMVVLPHAAPRR